MWQTSGRAGDTRSGLGDVAELLLVPSVTSVAVISRPTLWAKASRNEHRCSVVAFLVGIAASE